jgi:hypothetical protein
MAHAKVPSQFALRCWRILAKTKKTQILALLPKELGMVEKTI